MRQLTIPAQQNAGMHDVFTIFDLRTGPAVSDAALGSGGMRELSPTELELIYGGAVNWGAVYRGATVGLVSGAVGGAITGAIGGTFIGGIGAGPGAVGGFLGGAVGGAASGAINALCEQLSR